MAIARASVLGIHYQRPPEIGTPLTESIRASGIQWIKGIDPEQWPAAPGDLFPRQRVLARLWIGGDAIEHAYMRDGARGAEAYFARVRDRLARLRDGGCLDWAGPNEPHPGLEGNDPTVFEAFWRRLVELYHGQGGHPWTWSFGMGWPQLELVHHHARSIQEAIQAGGGLEVHEYGAPSVSDGGGFWTLRILRILDRLYSAGLARGRSRWVLVGECGIAWAVISGNPDVGWRAYPGHVYPPQHGLGYGVMDEERYWRQMSWLDDQYGMIPEIDGATPFVSRPNQDWITFDWHDSLIQQSIAKHGNPVWSDDEIGAVISDRLQSWVLPLNPAAALYRAARARDVALMPASPEVPGPQLLPDLPANTIAQAFRKDQEWQHIAWTRIGEWAPAQVRWVRRRN
jgi:hypothetical protein